MAKAVAHRELTAKQLLFLKFYFETNNATQATIKAGYSARTAGSASAQLLRNPAIQEAIVKYKNNIRERTIVTFQDKADLLWEMSHDPNIDPNARIKAIQELNKMQGHLAPDKQITVNVDSTLEQLKQAQLEYKDH